MRFHLASCILAATAACAGLAGGQPPEGRDGPPPDHRDGIRDALDTNGDHQLDADEIRNAATSLKNADRDGDGRIGHDEFAPPMPRREGDFRGPPGPPPDEAGPEGRPPRDGGFEGRRPRDEIRGGPRAGRPPRDGRVRPEGGPRGEGPPSPERMVERAMTFDADGDGKLDRSELEKFAGDAMQRLRSGMMAARGGPPAERGGGFREGDGPRRRPGNDEGGDRPPRPRRPE